MKVLNTLFLSFIYLGAICLAKAQSGMTIRQLYNYQPGDIIITTGDGYHYGNYNNYDRYKTAILEKLPDSAGMPGYRYIDSSSEVDKTAHAVSYSAYKGIMRVHDPDSSVWKIVWEWSISRSMKRHKDTNFRDTCNRLHYMRYTDNLFYTYDSATRDSTPPENGESMYFHFIEGVGYSFTMESYVNGYDYTYKSINYCMGNKCHCDEIETIGYSGIKQFTKAKFFNIYPNPATDRINILGLPNNKIQEIEIIGLDGRALITSRYVNTINVSTLKAGVYSVKVFTGGSIHYGRFVKQ